MNNKRIKRYYFGMLAGVAIAVVYPIYMGISVLLHMLREGAIPIESYPKYVIPYTPIALALVVGALLLPLFQKLTAKKALLPGAAVSIAVFFITERFMETKILVQTQELVPLESWQMSLCYVPPEMYETRTWEAVDVLLDGYSPAFKLHFYLISVVIILSLLNCVYGFAMMIRTGEKSRKKALILQTVTSLSFLGMSIWACFTAFYRTGEITVSAFSAALMSAFFILLGVTTGVFLASFTLGKRRFLSVALPAILSAATTLAMYIGEMILLSGNLYRFGSGVFFNGLGRLVLAPADLCVIIASGGITLLIASALQRNNQRA